MNKIIILGGGMVGRLAKLIFPEATVLESKKSNDIYTAELGVQISIVPIPGLKNIEYKRFIYIDHKNPTLELIDKYRKKIGRDGDLTYGDYRQFEYEQTVFKQEFPKAEIRYEHLVLKIHLLEHSLNVLNKEKGTILYYDYLISTIPLLSLIQISNLCSSFQERTMGFFMHRPIYLSRTIDPEPKAFTIIENYITDSDVPIYRENYVDGWRNQESLFKIPDSIKVYPGKIYPNTATAHILEDFKSYRVFCIGRYAQWDNTVHLWNSYEKLKLLGEVI